MCARAFGSQEALALHPITGCWHRAMISAAADASVLVRFDHSLEPLEFIPRVQEQHRQRQRRKQHYSWHEGMGGEGCLAGARVEVQLVHPGGGWRGGFVVPQHCLPPRARGSHLLEFDDGAARWHHMPSETFRVCSMDHRVAAGSRRVVRSHEPPVCVVPRPPPIDVRDYQPDRRFHTINGSFPGLEAVHRDPWVFLVHDVFTDAECDALVDKARPHLKPSHMGGGLRPDMRTSSHTRCFFEETAGVQHRLSALLNLPTANFEGLKVIQYQKGEFFKAHNDGFRGAYDPQTGRSLWPCVPGDYPNRIVTLVAYLNDVPRGGSTYFNKLELEVRPRKGMGLLFMPSFAPTSPETPGEQYPVLKHEGRECVDEKWIANQWGWGCEYIERLDPKSGFPPARLSATSI
jgi:prolyl 4-hydroxylase